MKWIAAPLLLLALPAAAVEQGVKPEAFTVSSYTAMALGTSPEVRSAYESRRSADAAYKSQLAAMLMPTVAFSASAYPYGDNPANGFAFQTWRLNRRDMSFNTTLNWNVFNSFQDLQKTRAASLALESASRAYWVARQDRALAAVQAFYALDTKAQLLEVARQNLKAQEDQYQQSLDLYNNGMKSLADLLKSETDWRSSQLRLLDSEADEKRSRAAFNILIDRPEPAPAALKADLEPGTTALPYLDGDLAKALEGRPEIVRARKDAERARVAVEQAVQGLLPALRADVTWNRYDQANFGISNASLGIPSPNYYVGLSLSLPFGYNALSQAFNVAQAKAAKRQADEALASAARQARSDVYGAYLSLDHDVQTYALAVLKEDIARRTLDLVSGQYRENTADAIRMNQAQTDLLDAQVARTLALHAIFTDRAQYKRAVGEQLW